MSTVNIVMATYNGENYIREQLDSILNSTYTDWSLAVFDDNSSDATAQIVSEYATKYSERIFLYRNHVNEGSTKNFLKGLKLMYTHAAESENAQGSASTSNRAQYFMFADQDDVWLKDKLERTMTRMKLLEKKYGRDVPALVFTDAVAVDQNLQFLKSSFISMSHLNTKKTDLPHMLMENKCMGCTMMINAALAGYVYDIPEGVRYHDWWIALLAATFGHISYLSEQSMLYRIHGKNQVGGQCFAKYCASRLKGLRAQKAAIAATQRQAQAFLEVYGARLDKEKRYVVQSFAELGRYNWFARRWEIIKQGYLKTGIIRNIGLMLTI